MQLAKYFITQDTQDRLIEKFLENIISCPASSSSSSVANLTMAQTYTQWHLHLKRPILYFYALGVATLPRCLIELNFYDIIFLKEFNQDWSKEINAKFYSRNDIKLHRNSDIFQAIVKLNNIKIKRNFFLRFRLNINRTNSSSCISQATSGNWSNIVLRGWAEYHRERWDSLAVDLRYRTKREDRRNLSRDFSWQRSRSGTKVCQTIDRGSAGACTQRLH